MKNNKTKKKENKSPLIILLILILLLLSAVVFLLLRGREDAWICENDQWVKHGNPTADKPSYDCGILEKFPVEPASNEIQVFSPTINQVITSPLEISGKATGSWFFEASFPVELLDGDGKLLASGIVSTQDRWMTKDLVPFTGSLEFDPGKADGGMLVLRRDNPSGLPENDKAIIVPVRFEQVESEEEKTNVKVFFNNSILDPEISCVNVFSINREIEKTPTVAKAAIEELLKGPTEAEKADGYNTSITRGVKLNSITIQNGTAFVDFDEKLEAQTGGSCRVGAITSQITETLKQFSSVQSVVISINGRTEDILQP